MTHVASSADESRSFVPRNGLAPGGICSQNTSQQHSLALESARHRPPIIETQRPKYPSVTSPLPSIKTGDQRLPRCSPIVPRMYHDPAIISARFAIHHDQVRASRHSEFPGADSWFLQVLGRGVSGKVVKGMDLETGQEVAVKISPRMEIK